jgi:hypothetical protein
MITLRNSRGQVTAKAQLTDAVQPKMLYLPLYYDGAAVAALFDADSPVASVEVARS